VIVAFIAGLGLGWLLWRWRRNNADADQLHAMRREIVRYQTDLRRLQSGDSHSVLQSKTTAVELASANKRIDTLAAELRESREALARQRDLQDVAPARPPVAASPILKRKSVVVTAYSPSHQQAVISIPCNRCCNNATRQSGH